MFAGESRCLLMVFNGNAGIEILGVRMFKGESWRILVLEIFGVY